MTPIEMTYEDTEDFLDVVSRGYARKFRRPLTEMRADADYYFVDAYHDFHNHAEENFEAFVRRRVRGRIYDQVRLEARRAALLRRAALDPDTTAAPARPFRAWEFLADLRPCARAAVAAALAAGDPEMTLETLAGTLRAAGYTVEACRAAFREIKAALHS